MERSDLAVDRSFVLAIVLLLMLAVGCAGNLQERSARLGSATSVAAGDEEPTAIHGVVKVMLRGASADTVVRLARVAPGLRELVLRDSAVAAFEGLSRFRHLERLVVEGASFDDVHSLEQLAHLEHLELTHRGQKAPDLSALDRLPRLQSLRVTLSSRAPVEVVLRDLPVMRRLRVLTIVGDCRMHQRPDLTALSTMPGLTDVTLSLGCGALSLEGLQHGHVSDLSLAVDGVVSLRPLADAPSLRRLTMVSIEGIWDRGVNVWTTEAWPVFDPPYVGGDVPRRRVDLSDLAKVTQLRELEIRSTRTFDLAFLNGLNRLERLMLADVSVVDPSALNALRRLRACRVAVELTADVTDMGYTSAEKTISDLETFFSRRKCPRHCESGCSTEGPYVRLH